MAKPKKKHKPEDDDDEGETDEQLRLRRCGMVDDEDDKFKPKFYSSNPVIQKFIEDHGDFIRERGQMLFKDGARLEVGVHGYGMQYEPPENEHELAKLRVRYFKVKCDTAVGKFRDYKELVIGSGEGVIFETTEKDQKAKLKKLRDRARKARERLHTAQKEVEDTTPHWINVRNKLAADAQRKKSDMKDWAKNIKL